MAITLSANPNVGVDSRPDEDLEQAYLAHEQWALEALYVRHAKTFYAAAFSVLKSTEDAQDCVHDVLLRLWQRESSYSPGRGTLKAFISVCIRNDALSRLRSKRRVPELEKKLAGLTEEQYFEPFDHVEHNRLVQALRTLPQAQRQAVVMSYFQHLTHKEIAARLDEPIGTIKSRLSSAVQRLRGLLAESQHP